MAGKWFALADLEAEVFWKILCLTGWRCSRLVWLLFLAATRPLKSFLFSSLSALSPFHLSLRFFLTPLLPSSPSPPRLSSLFPSPLLLSSPRLVSPLISSPFNSPFYFLPSLPPNFLSPPPPPPDSSPPSIVSGRVMIVFWPAAAAAIFSSAG